MRILQPRLAGVEQLLVTYPGLSAAAPSVVPGDGRVHFGLVLNVKDPPYCQNGYLQQAGNGDPQTTWQRADAPPQGGGGPQGYFPMNPSVFCNQPLPVNPRGAQHIPELDGSPRPGNELVNPNTFYGPGYPAGAPQAGQASPAASSAQASTQNANQNTAFSGVSSPPADVLANSGRGAPPIVIPGLG
jgi:phospholipid/cholesterol/gamma-HCH transport system substrate-binding protein